MSDREPQQLGDLAEGFRKMWGMPDGPLPEPPPVDRAAERRKQRMEIYKRQCPAEFLQPIDRRKIKNLAAWDEADAWPVTFPGCWLWSRETGEAKSRMLWRQFGRAHVEKGMSVQRTTGLNLSEEYHDCHKKNCTSQFYRQMAGTEVVMLDDLDKMNLPAGGQGFGEREEGMRNARMLRELFDTFYEEHTRVLVTANEPISWFAERIGESAERRMRAVCTEIHF